MTPEKVVRSQHLASSLRHALSTVVMPGLDPGIQRPRAGGGAAVDRRIKTGDDDNGWGSVVLRMRVSQ